MATKKKANSTSFSKDKQPSKGRGRSNKTIILEAMRDMGALELTPESTNDDAEKAFFSQIIKSAMNPEDSNSGMCLKLLSDKGWASLKPSSEHITFDFNIKSKPHLQAAQILKGMADGLIPPDLAGGLIKSIKDSIDIEEYTDLKARIISLEKMIKEQ
ncbi:MAG: hypothetical protein V3R25_05945 [Nitrosomonadaceae bacterium]